MVSDIKRKEILTVKEMLDIFENRIGDFKKDMDAIDEKYRAIIEKEKKDLKANLADCKSQLKVWQKMFNSFDPEAVKEVLGEAPVQAEPEVETVEETPVEPTEVVDPHADEFPVDNLFPSEEPVQEEAAAEPAEPEPKENDEDSIPVEEPVSESGNVSSDDSDWGESAESSETDENDPDNDGWNMPEEW